MSPSIVRSAMSERCGSLTPQTGDVQSRRTCQTSSPSRFVLSYERTSTGTRPDDAANQRPCSKCVHVSAFTSRQNLAGEGAITQGSTVCSSATHTSTKKSTHRAVAIPMPIDRKRLSSSRRIANAPAIGVCPCPGLLTPEHSRYNHEDFGVLIREATCPTRRLIHPSGSAAVRNIKGLLILDYSC